FQQGQAVSQIYTQPGSKWNNLLSGGGLGPGTPDPVTGYDSIVTPSLNFRYPQGSSGRLLLIAPPARVESGVVNNRSAQRSRVTSLTVTFDHVVAPDAGAFGLHRQAGGGVSLNVAATVEGGRSVAAVKLAGSGIMGGSLAAGHHALTIRSDLVHDNT